MRYGSVLTRDSQAECMAEAVVYVNQPFLSDGDEGPLRLVVRRNPSTKRWEAAWEEQS